MRVRRTSGRSSRAEGADWHSRWQSRCVVEGWGPGTGLECLDGDHEPETAERALVQRLAGELLEAVAIVRGGLVLGLGRRHVEQAPAQGELVVAVAAGKETAVANPVEVAWQDVLQKAPDELPRRSGSSS